MGDWLSPVGGDLVAVPRAWGEDWRRLRDRIRGASAGCYGVTVDVSEADLAALRAAGPSGGFLVSVGFAAVSSSHVSLPGGLSFEAAVLEAG